MIIFVGDKPSKHNVNSSVAFVGTKSYKTLLGWIADMDINIENVKLKNSKDLDNSNIRWLVEEYYKPKFVALGLSASKALDKLGLKYFSLPHPSGLNRKLNNKKWLAKQLKECKQWLTK